MSEKKLLQLLKKKRGFFEAILDLTEEEGSLPIPEWISNLEQKKVLLSCVDEVDEMLQPFKASFANLSQEIDEELDTIKDVVGKILKLDSHNYEKRRQQFDET
ncbi:MAG: hypothetical protein S4CHLAM45_00380 [Chlamydiales bacterium]|nr:hypothetical protein [Chlamydiales bacterium]MCH9619362.1 hypothetical protein [Chlamydiales bacterium]MCH9622166.1 hypothetical protein [Chlamydiales bacterium]